MEENTTFDLLTGLALLTPLASFLLCLIISERYSWLVTITAPVLLLTSASISIYLFFTIPANTSYLIQLAWFHVGQYTFNGNVELNRLSILMMPLIAVISFLVHLYSVGYMAGDNGIRRYFAMLGFFTFSMLGIVLSDNLLMIFVFWELVGFTSYMLIGHWLEKPAAAKAAQKAFLFNRIGDAGFLVGLMIVWANTQNFDLSNLLHLPEIYSWQTAASLCIFCGVIGKSAQLPLFTWLPDAMEGPTPVSALIHAATMVAAGVFLLARVFPLFTPEALHTVAITGILTALVASLCALNQFDIKKILAYSTISQLGLMVTAVGVGSENAAMLQLVTHAFFKACLFLGAGSIIHSLHFAQQQACLSGRQVHEDFDVQDIRNLGGLRKKLPVTFFTFLIAGASLAGIPLFSGFISKDSIITGVWYWSSNTFSWRWLILISVFAVSLITVLYTFRMVWFIFFAKESRSNLSIVEAPWIMRIPLIVLALASVWFLVSLNPFSASGWFTTGVGDLQHSNLVTLLSSGVVLLALLATWFMYATENKFINSITFLQNSFGLDLLYEKVFGQSVIKLAAVAETTDRKWIDGFLHFTAYTQVSFAHVIAWFDTYVIDGSVNAMAWISGVVGSLTRSFQGGKIQLYIFWALVGLIIFLFFVLI